MESLTTLPSHRRSSPLETYERFPPLPPFLPEEQASGMVERAGRTRLATALGSAAIDAATGLHRWFKRVPHTGEPDDHHHHTHHDEHDHHHDTPLMSERTANRISLMQLGSAAINGAVMLWKGVREGAGSINAVSATDAIHNVFDWAKWKAEAYLDHRDMSPRTYKIVRSLTCAALAGSGGWSIADATILHSDYNVGQGLASTVSAGASLATLGIVGNAIRKKYSTDAGLVDLWRNKLSERDKDKLVHAGTDVPISLNASIANLGAVVAGAGNFATLSTIAGGAAAIGYFGVYSPFIRGLDKADSCALHDHSKDTHSHKEEAPAELQPKSTPELLAILHEHREMWNTMEAREQNRTKRNSWWRRAVAVGSLAVATCLGAGGTTQEASAPPLTNTPVVSQPTPTPNTSFIAAQPGDSQWSIARQEIIKATGITTPQERHIDEVAQHIAHDNRATVPLPQLIYPDEQLRVPSVATIYAIVGQ